MKLNEEISIGRHERRKCLLLLLLLLLLQQQNVNKYVCMFCSWFNYKEIYDQVTTIKIRMRYFYENIYVYTYTYIEKNTITEGYRMKSNFLLDNITSFSWQQLVEEEVVKGKKKTTTTTWIK